MAKTAALVEAKMDPPAMLSHAVQSGAGVEVLEKLLALQERWQANQARLAFDAAMAAARAEIKPIAKRNAVEYESRSGKTSYHFESLGDIADAVDPILAKHGLSYRYRSSQDNGSLAVTCIVSHEDGHFSEATLSAGYDVSGGKNPIQAVGSAVTYLQRYTLKLALGLATARDDDGQAAGPRTDAVQPAKPQVSFRDYVMAVYNRVKAISHDVTLGDSYTQLVEAEVAEAEKLFTLKTTERQQLSAAVIEAWGLAWIALITDPDACEEFSEVIDGMPIKPARKEELRAKLNERKAEMAVVA